jgi:hypothetical protein
VKRPFDLRNRKAVLAAMTACAIVLFAAGIFAAFLSRHNSICPDKKPPVAQRSDVIGPTEYRCANGVVVTK